MSEIKINIHLAQRRSRRAFDSNKPVSDADLNALLEAARWAPSGGNGQPWRYVIGHKGDATYEVLFGLLMPGNQGWAQNATVLALTVAQVVRIASDGKRQPNRTALHDLGMANMSIAAEATERGLNIRMMGGYNYEAAKKLVDAETHGFDLGPMMAIGWLGDGAGLDADLIKRDLEPRTRKPIEEMRLAIA